MVHAHANMQRAKIDLSQFLLYTSVNLSMFIARNTDETDPRSNPAAFERSGPHHPQWHIIESEALVAQTLFFSDVHEGARAVQGTVRTARLRFAL